MFLNNSIIKIREDIPWQQDGDKALILDANESFAHELNSSALFIWKKIKSPISVKELHNFFINEYEAETKELEKDLQNLLAQLNKFGLIEVN